MGRPRQVGAATKVASNAVEGKPRGEGVGTAAAVAATVGTENAIGSCFVELEVSEVADPGFKTIGITKVPVTISGYLSQRAPQ